MIGRAQGQDIINEGKETAELARAYGFTGRFERDRSLEVHRDYVRFIPLALPTLH